MFKTIPLILIMLFTLWALPSHGGTCTSVSRTNNSANSVLTSTKYNSDLNTLYTAHNAFDGGCVTDGTLELASFGSDIAPVTDSIKKGCKISKSDAATVSISECTIGVNGNVVDKSSSTTVTWGCTGCASEAASTDFYVYIKDGSTGSTLTPLISTTAPNDDGYDGSNNRVIGRFYNNNSSDIDDQMAQWTQNKLTGFSVEAIAVVRDEKSSGSDGGTCTSGAFRTRDITVLTGDTGFITLSSNQITLLPGTYYIDGAVTVGGVTNNQRIRLRNITDSSNTLIGTNNKNGTSGGGQNVNLRGVFTIASAKTFEIQNYCSTTLSTVGFGENHGLGIVEVYLDFLIFKLVD